MKTSESKDGYCGPGRLAFVAHSLGLKVTVNRLAEMMGTTAENGTLPEKMMMAARQLELQVSAGEYSGLDQLEQARHGGAEVIVDWLMPDGPNPNPQKDGHYSILARVTADQVTLVDPWAGIKGEDVFWDLTREEFMGRWYDVHPDDTKIYNRWAMVIWGRSA